MAPATHDPFATAGEHRIFLTAAGCETYLLFQQGFPLREFCAFEVFEDEQAVARLEAGLLFPLLDAAHAHGHGLVVDALVWGAHPDYLARLGIPAGELSGVNRRAVARTRTTVEAWRRGGSGRQETPVLVAGDVGPRGDGYRVSDRGLAPESARDYHRAQLDALAEAEVDLVCALTMTTPAEAIGVALAASQRSLPVVVSATVETDGRLPDGTPLGDFVRRVDDATAGAPLFHMVNCAHPSHLLPTLEAAARSGAGWLDRFRGFRANASSLSHAELDEASDLDRGEPSVLAREVAAMSRAHGLRLVGGCCGTDAEHLGAIAREVAG